MKSIVSSQQEEAQRQSGDWSLVSRTAVLADAEGLLTCYGVGEESSAQLTHAVIELCFTSSVRFLQPGLLLQVCQQADMPVLWTHSGRSGLLMKAYQLEETGFHVVSERVSNESRRYVSFGQKCPS